MKLTREQKLKLAKEHIEEGIPLYEISKKYNYEISNVKYQCSLYQRHGEKAFSNEKRSYTREEKLKAIRRHEEGTSIRQIALDIGLPDATILGDWVKIYRQKGEAGIKDTNSRNHYLMHEERLNKIALDSMQERMKYLEAENEYLKKLYSLILERSKRLKRKSKSFMN